MLKPQQTLDSAQWYLQNGTHIGYQYSFCKNCRKAVKVFLSNNRKTSFEHNRGYLEYFSTLNILKCVKLNSLQLLKLMLSLLSYTTEDN